MNHELRTLTASQADLDNYRQWLDTTDFNAIDASLRDENKVHTLETSEGRQFQTYADIPDDAEEIVLSAAEYANGLNIHCDDGPFVSIYRSMLTRDYIAKNKDTSVGVIYQPGDGHWQNSLNLSAKELHTVANGDFSPIAERQARTIDALAKRATSITVFGPSLGGAIGLQYLNNRYDQADTSALIIDTPDHTTPTELLSSGNDINQNRSASLQDREALRKQFMPDNKGLAWWTLGILRHKSNRATAKGLARFDLDEQFSQLSQPTTALYANNSRVSAEGPHLGLDANYNPNQQAFALDGDHTASNNLPLMYAGLREHFEMLERNDKK